MKKMHEQLSIRRMASGAEERFQQTNKIKSKQVMQTLGDDFFLYVPVCSVHIFLRLVMHISNPAYISAS